jgi:uncharacterized membrane protein
MKREELIAAVGLGAVTGLRSMTALALIARELSGRTLRRPAGRLQRWLARDRVAAAIGLLAVGEIIADKLPGLPDRIRPGPLGGRAGIAGLLGAMAVDRGRLAGACTGAAAAVGAAHGGWWVRRELSRSTALPDPIIALLEDAVAIVTAGELVDRL